MRHVLIALVLAVTLTPACKSKDNTKIVVAVWSDMVVPTELDTVFIDVTGPTSEGSKTFHLTTESALPVQLELVPLAAKDATFMVTAVGQKGANALVSQSARVSFVTGQALLLKLFLGRACEGMTCTGDTTCSAGTCSQPIATVTLPPYDPSKPLVGPDAGAAIDSSVGNEAGPAIDSQSSEAATPDLRLVETATIDAQQPDVPLPSGGIDGGASETGGRSGSGGSSGGGGSTGAGGTSGAGGAPAGDGTQIDGAASDGTDVPIVIGAGGAGAVTGSGGTGGGVVGTGGTSGSGGAGGTGGSTADAGPDAPQGSPDACIPETNQQMCTRLGKNCNAFSGTDNCGQPRSITSCGACTSGLVCGTFVANVCPTVCTLDQSSLDQCVLGQ